MVDLEQQLSAWVDAETDGVDPVTADEALARVERLAPSPSAPRPGRWAALGAVAAVLLLVAAVVVMTGHDDGADDVRAGTTSATAPSDAGWTSYAEPRLGWTLERPTSSTVQSWQSQCELDESGSLITLNPQPEPVERGPNPDECTTSWSPEDLSQPGFVALQVAHGLGGPALGAEPTLEDTPPGLALGDLQPEADGDTAVTGPGGVRILTKSIVIDGDPRYSVTAWIAPDAPASRIADLRRMVRSIRWGGRDESGGSIDANASGNPRTATFVACMRTRGHDAELVIDERAHIDGEVGSTVTWGDGVRERSSYADDFAECRAAGNSAASRLNREFTPWLHRPGPSQSPADALRDGVFPEVATVPIEDRAVSNRFVDTDEGTWSFTEPADRFGGAGDADGCLGDRAGRYGVDYVCAGEYSEVVLVDADRGTLLRAYPFPGLPLTWMRVGPDAVYAGRWGDGGTPDSVVVRIDRSTLAAEVVLFPYDDPAGPERDIANDLGSLDPDAMGWAVAAPEQRARLPFGGPEVPGGVLADTAAGLTMLDLAALEELFA